MEQQLQKLNNLFSSKFSTTITANSNKSNFEIRFPIPLILDNNLNYELGLSWFSCYNTIFNITNENNKYNIDDKQFKIVPGANEIKEINNMLNSDVLEIKPYLNTSKCLLIIKKDSILKFNDKSFFHTVLGFEVKDYIKGSHISKDIIQITNISTINIICDLIDGSYNNGVQSNILYSFPVNTVPFGYKLIERMYNPAYLPVTRKMIDNIRIKIEDENGNEINFNGEEISIYLHLRQV